MEEIDYFNFVRDIPYRIPLRAGEESKDCIGKHKKLMSFFRRKGYKVRYRVCYFYWKGLKLPKKIMSFPHERSCSHVFLEIKKENHWRTLDATWDSGLKGIFKINKWDGRSGTPLAVKPYKILGRKASLSVVKSWESPIVIRKDLKQNGTFYRELNRWLRNKRQKKQIRKRYNTIV